MLLSSLLADHYLLPLAYDGDVSALSLDSRSVISNGVFFAVPGNAFDGRSFIAEAIKKGPRAILKEADQNDVMVIERGIPIIPIPALSQKIGKFAAHFYDHPANSLKMIGITGTNGKTSCAHFIAQLLSSFSFPCGIIGTLGNGFYGALEETGLTTPDPISLQKSLAQFLKKGATAVAMEVSSHSIDQGRVNDIDYEFGIFTNLSQDHLDYHGTMENYAAVKKRFFYEFPVRHLILNADDPYGKAWLMDLSASRSVVAYSKDEANWAELPDVPCVIARNTSYSLSGIETDILSPWGEGKLFLPLIGEFNLSNSLAVFATLASSGISFNALIEQLSQLKAVPGRMEILTKKNQPTIVVDYSHTPDSLQKALTSLNSHTSGKVGCIFGCGGDRDVGKRPQMAKIAEEIADFIIVTSDNPRHEDPDKIIQDILAGFSNPERVLIEPDRSKAIEKGIQWAKETDSLLIAGKGAERYQQIGDKKTPFSDAEKVLHFLENETG